MTVRITPSVWRAYRETEESVGVLVKADLPREALDEVVAQVIEQFADDDPADQLTPVEYQATMKGPAVVLADVGPDDLRPVLERLAGRLTKQLAAYAVPDVTLTAMPTINPFGRGPGRLSLIQAWLGLRGRRPDGWTHLRRPAHIPNWEVDPADLDTAIDELVAWALALPGASATVAVSSETYFVPVPCEAVLPIVRRVARQRHRPLGNHVIVRSADGRFRWINLLHEDGNVLASEGAFAGVALDWPAALGDMQRLLARAGSWCAYGHLTRGFSLRPRPDNGDRHVGKPWSTRRMDARHVIEDGTLWDAYGVMRLPRGLADNLDLEPTWRLTSLSDEAVIAEHHDLKAWYAARPIQGDVIAEARAKLDNHLIDRSTETLSQVE